MVVVEARVGVAGERSAGMTVAGMFSGDDKGTESNVHSTEDVTMGMTIGDEGAVHSKVVDWS